MRHAPLLLVVSLGFGCGISLEEHRRLVQQNLDKEKVVYDAEMAKMRATCQSEFTASVDRIGAIETELKLLGLDVDFTKSDMGTQLKNTLMELELLRKQRAQAEKDAAQFRAIAEKLKDMIDAGRIQVVKRKGRMTLKLPDEILFPPGSTRLLKEGTDALVSVIEVLETLQDREFVVAGHTDNMPLGKGGAFKSNWELSTARALEVVRVMVASGIPAHQLAAAGYGEFDPIAGNETKEGRAQNRRLEIIVMPRIQEL